MNSNQQAAEDFATFSAPDPAVQEANKKEREAIMKERQKNQKALKPEQLKAAKELSDSMKADAEAAEKAQLIQQLHDYLKHMREYYPERLEYVKAPKNFGPKNTCEELRVWVKDIQNELGKKGGLDTVKMLWSEGFKFFEKINEGGRFGLQVQGLGTVAEQSVMPRQLPDGSIIHGPAVPTLAEFAVKHSNWFSTDVDVRVVLMAVELVAGVHRMNVQKDMNVQKAAQTPVSKDTKQKMDAL